MNQTPNYQLNQWEATDKVQRVDFNADNAKIDGALGMLAAQMATRGNCQIVTGQYTGTGTFGKDKPTTFTFDKPVVLFGIATSFGIVFTAPNCRHAYLLCKGSSSEYNVIWTGQTSVGFWAESAPPQFNDKTTNYSYFAIMIA